MNKFNSLAASAKAQAEKGRQQFTAKTQSGTTTPVYSADNPPPPRVLPPPAAGSTPFSAAGAAGRNGSVFVNMTDQDKLAFFQLLDEYFESRPQNLELLRPSTAAVPTTTSPPTPQRSRPVPQPPPRKKQQQLKALYDYAGTEGDDLPFKSGDLITLVEKVSDDWFKGELNGRVGLLPANYVQEM